MEFIKHPQSVEFVLRRENERIRSAHVSNDDDLAKRRNRAEAGGTHRRNSYPTEQIIIHLLRQAAAFCFGAFGRKERLRMPRLIQ
jgi:hypothetical protein